MAQPLHSWYLERPEGCTAQPTLHQHAEKNHLTFTGLEGKQIVWVKNECDQEFAMCCYYKMGFCEFSIVKPEKRGKLREKITRHVHAFASCSVCGYCVPQTRSKSLFAQNCSQCEEVLERAKLLTTEKKESDLKLREEALRVELVLQGEALHRKADELRLQQKRLDKAKKDHKKAQEQQVATSCQGKRTKRLSLHYPSNW